MQRLVQAATTLKPKGREAILPVGVETVVAGSTMLTVFLFARTGAISLEDKEVTFQTALGPMRVKKISKSEAGAKRVILRRKVSIQKIT